jgi:hypothetical protein
MRFYASSGMSEKLCELLISTSFELSGNAGNGAHLRITFVLLRYGVKFSLMLKPFIHWQAIVYRSVLREFRFALTLKQQLLGHNRLNNTSQMTLSYNALPKTTLQKCWTT